MNFIHPAVFEHLPKRARCSLVAVYSCIVANARATASGECDQQQEVLAKWLGCNVRTVKRHERELVKRGLVTVVHHGRVNRRRLQVVELRSRPRKAREWGQLSPHSGDSPVTTPAAAHTNERARAHASQTEEKNNLLRSRSAAPERRPSVSREPARPITAHDQKRLDVAIGELVERAGVARNVLREVRGDLVPSIVARWGVDRTVEWMHWLVLHNLAVGDRERRGKMTLGALRKKVLKLDEKGAPRTGRPVAARA